MLKQSKNLDLPTDVLEKLKELDENLEEEDITVKGYCKKKWILLQKYASEKVTRDVTNIQTYIAQKKEDEKKAYSKMFEVLRIENMCISEKKGINTTDLSNRKILNSTENLPQETDLTKPDCSTTIDISLKNSIITNFKKVFTNSLKIDVIPKNLNKRKYVEQTNDSQGKVKHKKAKTKENSSSAKLSLSKKKIQRTLNKRKSTIPINDSEEEPRVTRSKTKEISSPTKSPKNCFSNKRKSTELTNHSDETIRITRSKTNSSPTKTLEISVPNIETKSERCDICNQYLSDLLIYKGHPNGALEEYIALTNSKLTSFTEESFDNSEQPPHNKITNFTVYDKKGHLCSFDSGLIENKSQLYFSGYLKSQFDQNSENGIPVKDMGPINKWWTKDFDEGKDARLGFSTRFGEYYLMEPSKDYKPLMKPLMEKINLTKNVIEFFLKTSWKNPSYDDLLIYLQTGNQLSEENLLRHAQFICEQVTRFDSSSKNDLISTLCMKTLVKLAGVTFTKRKEIRKEEQKEVKPKKKSRRYKNLSKATTTELVRKVFESFFPEQLDQNKKQLGRGKKRQNTTIKTAEDSESDDNFDLNDSLSPPTISKNIFHSVTWLSDPIIQQNERTFYSSAKVGDEIINPGDHVLLKANKSGHPLLVAKVIYMFNQPGERALFHAHLFFRGVHTVLGEISDPREIFQVDECENIPLGSIVKKAEVKYENLAPLDSFEDKFCTTFFCQKKYDRRKGRFEDLDEDKLNSYVCNIISGFKSCSSCKRQTEKEKFETPVLETGVIKWRNEQFKIGTSVYLLPGTFNFKTAPVLNATKKEIDPVDEDIYPEFYRKKSENIIGIEISEPFCIGYITEILSEPNNELRPEDIQIKVQKMYRPENTHKAQTFSHQLDINLIYWSEEEETVSFSKVAGKCYIVYGDILDIPVEDWSIQGPNRFYFLQSYNSKTQEFLPVGDSGRFIGQQSKSRNKNWLKNKSKKQDDVPDEWFSLNEPLKTMDVFAGCGGLSEGLHQSGVADTLWAIEKEEAAALAFKQNNPQTIVYSEDCNELLSQIISGESTTESFQPLPHKGAVELLVGGPPCQGFSGMNRFNAGQYSLFKNSLIVSYLSYCDFYRPRFFILENVRNFVTFKKSMVLKLTLRCLLAMGYQCAFGVLQAGNYGVPQIRRRSIIFAAAPGEILPEYPEPLHVFTSKRANPLDVVIDNCRYNTGSKWLDCGAPYRTITVKDAMSDLPQIPNGCSTGDQSYDSEPLTHFQRMMRGTKENGVLRDHICKEMAALVEARMSYIPTAAGSDWRDLPNIEIRLPDGTTTKKLRYNWHNKRNGKNSKGSFRGVCPCASKKPCNPLERQLDTLIPWCLPHTANRHNNWAGLYGRLEWDGVFNTTVTNPEPMAKQGRVLHPVQNRVVSVRECARSQGFPDKYRFYGNVLDKHRQVGNAVPPPMGKAIGKEIMKSVILKQGFK